MDFRRSERNEGKVERIPFGGPQLKLQLSKADREGFVKRDMVPHWFNNQDGRIDRAQAAGYTFVAPKHARSVGSMGEDKVVKVVSKGSDVIEAYLMETKKEFYDEDQAAKEAINIQVDDALALGGKGGTDVEQAYRPD